MGKVVPPYNCRVFRMMTKRDSPGRTLSSALLREQIEAVRARGGLAAPIYVCKRCEKRLMPLEKVYWWRTCSEWDGAPSVAATANEHEGSPSEWNYIHSRCLSPGERMLLFLMGGVKLGVAEEN